MWGLWGAHDRDQEEVKQKCGLGQSPSLRLTLQGALGLKLGLCLCPAGRPELLCPCTSQPLTGGYVEPRGLERESISS